MPSSPNVSFLHLIGVAGGFGVSFWVTAIHGTIVYLLRISPSKHKLSGRAVQRMLSRQEFTTIQSRLSTVYLSTSTVLSSLSLGTFLLRHPIKTWSNEAKNIVCHCKQN